MPNLNMNTLIVRRERYLDTYSDTPSGRKEAEKGAAFLEENSVLPLDYKNGNLGLLTTLGALVYFSGNLRRDANTYFAKITGEEGIVSSLESFCLEKLGLAFRDKSTCRPFSTNGARYARLLYCMGWPISDGSSEEIDSRASRGTTLPDYVKNLVENYDELTTRFKKRARALLTDVFSAWAATKRCGRSGQFGLALRLVSQPDREAAEEEVSLYKRLVEIVYPKLDPDLVETSVHNSREIYTGEFRFGKAAVLAMHRKRGKRGPVKLEVRVDPMFSFNRS